MTIEKRIQKLRQELDEHLLDEFSKKLLVGAFAVYDCRENPVRLNQFAATLRELISHTLDELAPADLVIATNWYAAEADRPTRRQRMIYATQGGLPDQTVNELGLDAEQIHKDCVDAINDLSKFTHVRPGTLIDDDSKIKEFVLGSLSAFLSFLNVVSDCKSLVIRAVFDEIYAGVIEEFTTQTIQELDELSTHTFIDYSMNDDVNITDIDPKYVHLRVEGTVYVVLQYGSDGDRRRGDGASINDDYPFVIRMRAKVDKLGELEAVDTEVDNSSFYE
ncbi:MAG: hypothetical protein AAGI12_14095 [Pseudomonadota bacterium]